MKDVTDSPYGRFIPASFVAWVQARPVLNTIIALAAGFVLGKFL